MKKIMAIIALVLAFNSGFAVSKIDFIREAGPINYWSHEYYDHTPDWTLFPSGVLHTNLVMGSASFRDHVNALTGGFGEGTRGQSVTGRQHNQLTESFGWRDKPFAFGFGPIEVTVGSVKFPQIQVLEQKRYTILRNGEEIAPTRSNALQPGDIVRFLPLELECGQQVQNYLQEEKARTDDAITLTPFEAMEHCTTTSLSSNAFNDWVFLSGPFDTPPIVMLSPEEFKEVSDALYEEYKARYPCSYVSFIDNTCLSFDGTEGAFQYTVPLFEAEVSPFDPARSTYPGYFGYEAYVVPAYDGKKAGVQVFCSTSLSNLEKNNYWYGSLPDEEYQYDPVHRVYMDCTENEFGGIDCTIPKSPDALQKTGREVHVLLKTELQCVYFVDKIITEDKSVEADWFLPYQSRVLEGLNFQVISEKQHLPVADFSCELSYDGSSSGYNSYFTSKYACDASASYDPDGEIVQYEWDQRGQGPGNIFQDLWNTETYTKIVPSKMVVDEGWWQVGKASVHLRVTDNDGFYSEIVKTVPAEASAAYIEASYNSVTRKAEIYLECGSENALLDVRNAIKDQFLIEKQSIACNQTTEVGPITVPGAYKAIVESEGETAEAVFAVEETTG